MSNPTYTQDFISFAPNFLKHDEGTTFTVSEQASSRKQANRRIQALLYGSCCYSVSVLKAVPTKRALFEEAKSKFDQVNPKHL